MQLSAPKLPIDPSAGSAPDSAGFRTGGAKGEPGSYARDDFGAILAAKSRNKAGAPSSPRANRQPSTEKSTVSSDRKRAADDLPTERSPRRCSSDQSEETDRSVVAEESLVAAGVVLTTPPVAVPETVDAELEVTLQNAFPQADATDSDSTSESNVSSSSGSHMAPSQPILGGMLTGSAAQSGNAQTNPEQRAEASASFTDASSISTAGSDPNGTSIDSILGESVSLEQPWAELSEESGPSSSAPDSTQELESTISGEAPDVSADANDPVADLRRAAAISAVAEKIAAHRSRVAERVSSSEQTTQIISGVTDVKGVATSYGRIGINAAKSEAHMPATAPSQTPASLAMENPSFQVNPLSLDSLVKEGAGEATAGQVAFAARRAVESVLSIADQTASTDQRTVRLQFTVGGEELAVRVELRGERVHTTFRTDSPDLRIALAHEWQSVAAVQSGVRSQRLADPVFASASSSGNGMFSDSGAAYQRDSSARQPHASAEEIFGSRRAVSNTPAAAAVATAPTAVVAPSNSRRLHTFA